MQATALSKGEALAFKSMSPNTRRAYSSSLIALQRWLYESEIELSDDSIADYLAHLLELGKAHSSASMTIAAVNRLYLFLDKPSPVGRLAYEALKAYRKSTIGRGRGQSVPLLYENALELMRVADKPRSRGRGVESRIHTKSRAAVDKAIVALLFCAGLRRSEAAKLRWDCVGLKSNGDCVIRVIVSKTNQEATAADFRLVVGEFARAIHELAEYEHTQEDFVLGGMTHQSVNLRFKSLARAAGIESGLTAHSGRIGLAVELTARGASTHEVMIAGAWSTERMVAHYSAAMSVGTGAVSKYFRN